MRYLCVILCLFFVLPLIASTIPMNLTQQIQYSKLIIQGKVLSHEYFTAGAANALHTRYCLSVDKVLSGQWTEKEISVEALGGEDDKGVFRVSDVPVLKDGDTGIFFLEDPGKSLISPFTGTDSGVYLEAADKENGNSVLLNAWGATVRRNDNTPYTLQSFLDELKTAIPLAMALPKQPLLKPVTDPSKILQMGPELTANPSGTDYDREFTIPWGNGEVPQTTLPGGERIEESATGFSTLYPDRYISNQHWAEEDWPVVFNPVPSTYSMYPRDREEMRHWNRYADMFRLLLHPTGDFFWLNSRNDIAGFVSHATMTWMYGSGWDGNTIGMCFSFYNPITNHLWETDICLNWSSTWTDDYSQVYIGAASSVQNTLLHEQGHALGFEHNFYGQSVMNYYPDKQRAYNDLYADDTFGLRALYFSHSVAITDILVAGYKEEGYQNVSDGFISETYGAEAGENIHINDTMIENTGSATVAPVIEFYLTPHPFDWTDAVYVQTSTFPPMAPGVRYELDYYPILIPQNLTPGSYFVALQNVTPGDQLWENDFSWLHRYAGDVSEVYFHSGYSPKVWTGAYNNVWNNVSNWADFSLPTEFSDVTIPDSCANYPNVNNMPGHAKNLRIEAGATLEIGANSLTVHGDFQCAGSLLISSATAVLDVYGGMEWQSGSAVSINHPIQIRCGGNWSFMEGSNAQFNQGTVQFWQPTNSNISSHSNNSWLPNVVINKSNNRWAAFAATSTSDLRITGSFTVQNGSYFYFNSTHNLRVTGDVLCTSTSYLVGNQGNLWLNNPVIRNLTVENAASTVPGLFINGAGVVFLTTDLKINGDLSINNGAFYSNGHNIYLKGSWNNYLGPIAYGEMGSRVVLCGDYDQVLYNETFDILEMNKPGGYALIPSGSSIDVVSYDWTMGGIRVSGGSLHVFDLADNWIVGTYILDSGSILLQQDEISNTDLNCELNISDGTMTVLGGSGNSWWSSAGDLSITMSGGVLDFPDHGINIYSSPYILTENITGGIIRTQYDFVIERNDFTPQGGAVEMNGTVPAIISMVPGACVYNLNIAKLGAGVITGSDILVWGDLNLVSGTFADTSTVYLNGNWNNTAGPDAFIETGGTVMFQGSGHQYCSTENFNELVIAKSGGAMRAFGSNVSCTSYQWFAGAVDVLLGSFTANDLPQNGIYGNFYANVGGVINLIQTSGSWVDLDGFLYIMGGEIHVSGGTDDSYFSYSHDSGLFMTSGALYFHDCGVRIYNGAYAFTDSLTGGSIHTNGSFYCDRADFSQQGWTLVMEGSATSLLSMVDGSALYNLEIDKTSGLPGRQQVYIPRQPVQHSQNRFQEVISQTNLNLKGSFVLTNGTFHAPDYMQVSGNWFVSPLTSTFQPYSGTVALNDTIQAVIGYGSVFNNLLVDKHGVSNVDLTISNYQPEYISLAGLAVLGTLQIQSGWLNLNSYLMVATGPVTISSGGKLLLLPDSVLRLGTSLSVLTNGLLVSYGLAGQEAYISALGDSYYAFSVAEGGMIAASYTGFSRLDMNGVNVMSGAVVVDSMAFNYCSFSDCQTGGTLLRIETDQLLTVTGAVFPDNTWGSMFNVAKSQNQGHLEFVDFSGGFAGSTYESDPYGLVDWTAVVMPVPVLHISPGSTPDTVILNWDYPYPFDYFIIYCCETPNGTFVPLASTTGQTLNCNSSSSVYFYRVSAVLE